MREKILLLGHDRDNGLALARSLITFGFHPLVAEWDGFSPRRHRRDTPSAILADMDNPGAGPVDRLVDAAKKYWGGDFPVIAMSASRRFQHSCAYLEAGADDFLHKGAPETLTEKKIRRCLERRAPSRSPDSGVGRDVPGPLLKLFRDNPAVLALGELAAMYPGATPRTNWSRRMAPPDQDWRGVVTSEALEKFHCGRPSGYLLWSRLHLFRVPAPGEYSVPEKVLLSRCGPPLRAAVDKSRLPAGADVYSLVPEEGVRAGWLACILNSRLLDFYFNRLAGHDDGRLRLGDVQQTPVPRPDAAGMAELARCASLLTHFGPNPEGWIDRQSKEETLERMEEVVFDLYGADRAVREELAALHF